MVSGALSMGHARALLGADQVESLADQVIARGLSVRETEKLTREAKGGGRKTGEASDKPSGPKGNGQDAADAYEVAEVRYQFLDSLLTAIQTATWDDLLPIFRRHPARHRCRKM